MARAHQFLHMHAPTESAHGAGEGMCVAAAAPAANDEETKIESIK